MLHKIRPDSYTALPVASFCCSPMFSPHHLSNSFLGQFSPERLKIMDGMQWKLISIWHAHTVFPAGSASNDVHIKQV